MLEDAPVHPKCFDNQAEFNVWRIANRVYRSAGAGYCTDCNPKYKAAMLQADRCENPTVMFKKDDEGNLIGYLPAVKELFIPATEGVVHKWLKPDEKTSVRYLGPESTWHPVPGTFDRIPLPKKK